ncbi:hypothetical protein [Helicobacter sp. MIT 14-3879]|uniref:hypothetical protein n=1 Tax=Helicobacter sp. MIT 14-3879 TaxID=2040649 RepID=UPI000E1ED627|nr:hypothetical protein [Helicobacter sp. MIT 14-3879]RDU61488.1 hypothetical protein CQA44_08745 [Helicobacter sp. MIT 14-3879]
MKTFNLWLFFMLCLNTLYGASASIAINTMNTGIQNLYQLVLEQNKYIEQIVNIDKQILFLMKKESLLIKQRNELLNNAWHIEAENEF